MKKLKGMVAIVVVLATVLIPTVNDQYELVKVDEKVEKRGGPSHPIIDT
ncbi:hypothetical protein [Shouchella miscanthi]|nr:hypothetical protein [Shouchella miscanthi]